MTGIELRKHARARRHRVDQRYFEQNLPEPVGDLPAGLLLDFFLEEIGPTIYNKAITEAQTRLQLRIADLEGELYVDEFQYWPRQAAKRKHRP